MTSGLDNLDNEMAVMCDALFDRVRTEATRRGVTAAKKREDHMVTFRLPDARVLIVTVEYADDGAGSGNDRFAYAAAVQDRSRRVEAWRSQDLDEVERRLMHVFNGGDPFEK